MSKQVIVTGGAGFIGSHLVERLLADGHHVTVLDNLASGRESNLDAVRSHPHLTFHKVDVSDLTAITPLVEGANWVFHLAGLADIVPSIQHPQDYHHANVEGTLSMLEASRHAGVERFIYTASSSCYGIPDVFPTPESAPIQPMYPYALTKYLGECYALHWQQVYGLPVISLRLFNVYGPRSRTTGSYGAVFGVFLAQKLAGKPYTIVGDGTQTRDFTFISDVVDAFVAAAESSVQGKAYNVGSDNTHPINTLVALLGGDVVHLPKRPGEPDSTFADISTIKKDLAWHPKVSFENGVATMLKHLPQWQDAPVWEPNTIASATKEWFSLLKG